MHLLSALGCYSTRPPKHFLIVQGRLGDSDVSLPFCPDRPTNALWRRNLDFHPCTFLLSYCPLQQSTGIYPVHNACPDHNKPIPKPIPLVNAKVGEAFPATSVYMTSTIQAKKREERLARKKDSSPLPNWKSPGCIGCQPRHTTQSTCVGQGRTNVRTAGMKTTLKQSILQFLEKCYVYECLGY